MYFVYFFLSIPFRTRWKQESKQSNRGDYLGRKVNGTDDNNPALSRYERTMEGCATRRRCKISTSVWCKEGGWMMVDESVRERERENSHSIYVPRFLPLSETRKVFPL